MNLISFYSYKGGVGRTLAVANVGHAMIEDGLRKVLLIDFDLEAPGLSELPFCKPEYTPAKRGAREFITAILKDQQPNLLDHIAPIPGTSERLWIMPAGNNALTEDGGQLPDLSELADGDKLRAELLRQAEELGFHYGLVDSRTGLTEVGGLCTISLPDQLVILTGLNHQNIEGARWVLDNVSQARAALGKCEGEPLVVFSHVPDSEEDKKKARITAATERLGVELNDVEILYYHPRLSLEEELFVQAWPESRLAFTYQNLKRTLWRRNPEDHQTLLERLPHVALRFHPKKTEQLADIVNELNQIETTVRRLYPNNADLLLALAERYLSFDDTKLNCDGTSILGEAFKNLRLLDSESRVKCFRLWLESEDVEGFKVACERTLSLIQDLEPDFAANFIDNVESLPQRKSAHGMQLLKLDFLQRGHALVAAKIAHGNEQRRHWQSSLISAIECFTIGGPYSGLSRAIESGAALFTLPELSAFDWFILGNLRELAMDARGAEQAFSRALEIEPEASFAMNSLAETLLHMGRCDESISICRRGEMLLKEKSSILITLGNALVIQGKSSEAVELFKGYIERDPSNWNIANKLVRCLCELGDPKSLMDAVSIIRRFGNVKNENIFSYNTTAAVVSQLMGEGDEVSIRLKNAETRIDAELKAKPGNRSSLANGAELALILRNIDIFTQRASVLESLDNGFSKYSVLLVFMRWLNQPGLAPIEVIEKFRFYRKNSGYQILDWGFEEISAFLPVIIKESNFINVARAFIGFFDGRGAEEDVNKAINKAYCS